MKKYSCYLLMGLLCIGQFLLSSKVRAQTASKSVPRDTVATTKLLRANTDTSWTINVLQGPSSPGASLLGISPSVIQRPTDPAGFSASLLNATGNLTSLPSNYAVDFAPAWLFGGSKISYTDFQSNALGKNIWQTLDVSFATKSVKDSTTNQTNTTVAIGVKVSLLRGHINKKADSLVQKSYDMLSKLTKIQLQVQHKFDLANPAFKTMQFRADTARDTTLKKTLTARVGAIHDSLIAVANQLAKAELDTLKTNGQAINFARYGWKLDLAGGMSYLFPGQIYSNGSLSNAGAWLTGGYEAKDGNISLLGIARYLYNPKQAYADPGDLLKQGDLSTFDTGARLLFGTKDNKFTFGGEIVYRSILNNTMVKPSYHYSISTDYQVGKNQLISFNFGRDFDGTINKGGSLLAALNFIIGFGSSHSILPSK